tara:strand:- start:10097 stop:10690 length:594 start_codon:yes stop_codon:yes gene_type:complete
MLDCPRKIKLYGDLAEFIGVKEIETEVHTVADAVKCLIGNYPQAENYMMDKSYKVLVNEKPKILEELHFPTGQSDIKIVPVISGQGRGLGQILLGSILIGAAFMFPGAQFTGLNFTAASGFSGFQSAVGNIGIALVIGGVAQMLAPVPPTPTEDPDNSFAFNSPVNTTVAGLPVPILYGERMVGSVVISAGINVVDN